MNYVEKVLDGVQSVLRVNPATFSGAVDVIVVPHPVRHPHHRTTAQHNTTQHL